MQYDLIIVGGGLVGAGLAASLAESSLKIALIDAKLPQSSDPRLFALNHSSCIFLKNLKLFDELKKHASPIAGVHVSKKGSFGAVRLEAGDADLEDLGHVIPAYHIEAALNERLLTLSTVTIYRPATVIGITQNQTVTTVTVKMQDEELSLQTSLLVGADGVDSTVRRLLNIESNISDYQQTAIVTRTQLQRAHQHIAYERFTKEGAIAMLPLSEHEVATIWTADNAKAQELMSLSDAAFVQQLQTEFGYRLGKLKTVTKRHTFPLRMVCAVENHVAGVLLIGNAAHTLHPIAAQGFNLALYEVAVLSDALMQEGVINYQALQEQIKKQMQISIGVSHQLAGLFQYESILMKNLLPCAMFGMDKSPLLRRAFITRMLGRNGQVPRLLLNATEA